MSERPDVVLGVLLAAALGSAGLLTFGLIAVGLAGAVTMTVAVFSFCAILLRDTTHLPVGPVVLASLAAASSFALLRALVCYRNGSKRLRALPLELPVDPALRQAARTAGVDLLFVLPTSRPAAFCFGLVRPRIVVSSGLVEQLDAEELLAVLCHEAHHARLSLPLKRLAAEVAERALFWVPLLRSLLQRFVLLHELAADRDAVDRAGFRALAGALTVAALEPRVPATVGFSDLAQARVDRLFDPSARLPPLVRPLHGVTTLGLAAAFAVLTLLPQSIHLSETDRLHQLLRTFPLHGGGGLTVSAAAAAVFVTARRAVRPIARRDSDGRTGYVPAA